MQSDMI